jgi:hypothetical protein
MYGKTIITSAQLEKCIEKLHKTYSEAGGDKFNENELAETDGLNPFDATKVILVKKLEKIRDVNKILYL